MIWDSSPWKERLLADAAQLRRRAQTHRATEARSVLFERTILVSAHSMRKLDDAKKLSTSWRGKAVKCEWMPSIGKPPNFLNWHRLDKHYDLAAGQKKTIGARHFCHMVIHSYIFSEVTREDGTIEGIFVNSDETKSDGMWLFDIGTVIGLMEQTAKDYPPDGRMVLNDDTGEYEVWAGTGEPPKEWLQKAERVLAFALRKGRG
jgi:hypothetical protein